MNQDPYSLDNLKGLAEPGPVSWWPPTAGWWWMLALGVAAVAVLWLRWRTLRRRTAFKREGLAILARLEAANPSALAVSQLLKRVALAARPREEVASLSGAGWIQWLESNSGGSLPEGAARALEVTYSDPQASAPRELLDFARSWIRELSPRRPC